MTSRQLSIEWLRTLVLVSEVGSIANAARRLARPPGSLGYHLRCLEAEIGTPVFWHSRHGAELTDAGRLLLDYAAQLLELHDEALMSILALGVTGAVRLGIPQDLEERITPLLARFSRLYTGIKIEVRVECSRVLCDAVDTDQIDLALAFTAAGDGLSLGEYQLGWLGAARPDAVRDRPVPLVLSDPPCLFRDTALLALGEAGVAWRSVLTSPSLAGLWIAVRAGLGVTVRTTAAVPPGIVALDGLPDLPRLQLKLLSRSEGPSLAVRRLRDWLVDSLADASVGAPPS